MVRSGSEVSADSDNTQRQTLLVDNSPAKKVQKATIELAKEWVKDWFHIKDEAEAAIEETGIGSFKGGKMNFAIYLQNELSEFGLLSNYYNIIRNTQEVDIFALYKTCLLLNEISIIVVHMSKTFGEIQLVNFTGNQICLKIKQTGNKSIGFLYGFIETMKRDKTFSVSEYAATTTTLEQIFH